MRQRDHGTQLSAKRQVTLILRVVLDAQGRIESGEAVDAHGKPQGRFRGRDGLSRTVEEWLGRQAPGEGGRW
jgi:hypothetical protein